MILCIDRTCVKKIVSTAMDQDTSHRCIHLKKNSTTPFFFFLLKREIGEIHFFVCCAMMIMSIPGSCPFRCPHQGCFPIPTRNEANKKTCRDCEIIKISALDMSSILDGDPLRTDTVEKKHSCYKISPRNDPKLVISFFQKRTIHRVEQRSKKE